VVGEIMADLAENGLTRHDISLFRLDRLKGPALGAAGPEQGQPARDGLGSEQLNGRLRSFPRVEDIKTFW
jgi:sarcosine oxidase